jgi:hypothetical protein
VLVVILGLSFVAVVLVPGLELASEVADSSTALKLLGEQQRHPTLIRAALESIHDRLGGARLYPRVRGSIARFEQPAGCGFARNDRAAAGELVLPRWRIPGRKAGAIAGKHAAMLLDTWAKELVVLNPVLGFRGVPIRTTSPPARI